MASLAIAGILASATVLGGGSEPQPATAGADTAIRAIADQYVKATLAGDAKAIAALYTDDAVEMPPNAPLVKGKAALEQYYQKQFAAGKISKFSLNHLETRGAGDSGYDVGTYTQTIAPGKGAAMNDSGKYVVILKRVGGAWKVAYAIYNSDNPPPPAPKK
jgi:uncharacterized protein (TIGR02246 family)